MLLPEPIQIQIFGIVSDMVAVCDVVFTALRSGEMDCRAQGTMKITPILSGRLLQAHTVMRFHNLVVYRTAIFVD